MFSGIINNYSFLFILKYIFYLNKKYIYLVLKINFFNFIDLVIGDSISFNGICLTLLYKNFNFLEFELIFKTIFNIQNLEHYFFFNIEKSLKIYNFINGSLLLSHINNIFYLKKKYILKHFFYKYCFLLPLFFKKYIIYKSSISLNGVNLTINEIEFYKKSFLFCVNIINFTYNLTNFRNNKLLDIFNFEFDLTLYYILNFLNF